MSVVANVAINVDSSGAVSKLRQVQTQAQSTEKAFGALQSAIGALGVGFALTKVIADVKELDTNLRRLGTVGVDVAKISPALSKLSDELGGVASKAELAAASYQAASAGFSDTAGNINILRAATKAATGGLADTQAVTEVLVKTLNSYGMSGNQAIQVTDSISKAVELGNQEWSDYTSQLGRVASIAALAGVSLDEVNAFIASATKNGATAEIAFTGLGATLNTLLQPTKESQEAAAKLGIAWNYGGLQAKGFTGLMAELAVAMDKDKETTAKLLGSQEAMRGAFAAASKSGSDFKNILGEIGNAAGKTDADFQTMKGSLENTLKALDTSFKNLSEALGIAFGPTVVIAVQDITKAVNGFADFMATVPQPVMDTAGALVKLIAQMLLLQKAIQAIIALRAAFIGAMVGMTGATVASGAAATTSAGAFALYTNNARTLQATSIAATASVSGLAGALLGLAGIGIITVGINYVITQTGAILGSSTAAGKSEAAGTPTSLAAQLKGKTAAERKQMLAAAQKNLANDKKLASALALQIQMQDNAALSANERALPSDRAKLTELQARINTGQSRIKAIQTTPIERATATGNAMGTPIGATVGDGASGKKKGKTDAERAAEEARKLEEQTQERLRGLTRETELIGQITNLKELQAAAEAVGDQELQARLAGEEQIVNIIQNTAQELDGVTDKRLEQAILSKAETEILQAQAGVQLELQRIEDERQKTLQEIVTGIAEEITLVMATSPELRQKLELEQQIAKWKKEGVIKSEEEAAAIRAANAELEKQKKIREQINAQQQMLNDLYDGIANQIAGGVGSAIDAVASGVDNLGDALKDIGRDILAAVGKMLIFYAIAQALGALGGNDGVGIFSTLAKGFGFKGAKDGAFWPGGFQAFADGGLVTKPTMGLVGEGGEPEYIIPASKMAAAMKRYGSGARGSSVIPTSGDTSESGGNAAPVNGAIDVRYTVERINSVDYVTVDQFQRGMVQAATQGAQRGEQQVLRKLQQSPSTRRRVGVS